MSVVKVVTTEDLRAVLINAGLLEQGRSVEEWCRAREVSPEALAQLAGNQAEAVALAVSRGEGTLLEVLESATVLGFQAGVEVERRRRDEGELPL